MKQERAADAGRERLTGRARAAPRRRGSARREAPLTLGALDWRSGGNTCGQHLHVVSSSATSWMATRGVPDASGDDMARTLREWGRREGPVRSHQKCFSPR